MRHEALFSLFKTFLMHNGIILSLKKSLASGYGVVICPTIFLKPSPPSTDTFMKSCSSIEYSESEWPFALNALTSSSTICWTLSFVEDDLSVIRHSISHKSLAEVSGSAQAANEVKEGSNKSAHLNLIFPP